MTSPSNNHLRLHLEDPMHATDTGLDLPGWGLLQSAYQGLTGWQLGCQPAPLPPRGEPVSVIPRLYGDTDGQLYRLKGEGVAAASDSPVSDAERGPVVVECEGSHSRDLAQGIAGLLAELQATRQALQEREAELASAIPVIARRDEGADFHHRLQAILRGVVEGLAGRAAALYLLDDTTSELKLRAHWGLPSLRFLEPARPLRGAVADLEALTGHAVVLEQTELLAHWNVPEEFASAVCVPVSSPDTLLGTLWLFSDDVRDYSGPETQLIEIVAGRLAVELERRVLVQQVAKSSRDRDELEALRAWHHSRGRQAPPLIDGWQFACATVGEVATCGDFSTWLVGGENQLLLTCCSLAGPAVESMLSATLLHGAVQAILRQTNSPRSALRGLNDVLWSSAPGGERGAAFQATLNPASGRLDYATAGATDAYILRPHGWEPLVEDAAPLGVDSDWDGATYCQQIHRGRRTAGNQ